MTSRIVRTEADRAMLLRYLEGVERPFTVAITKGCQRTAAQNKLQRLWLNEIAEQTGYTPEEVRGDAKLRFGVPILRAENEEFCAKYDEHVKPLPYAQKMAFMMEPLDMPVTRIMTAEQKTRYLDALYRHYVELGFELTIPDADTGLPERRRAAA